MSIGKRLAILVAVAMLGLAGGGFYGVGKLRGMQSDFDLVTQRALPAMLAMNQISDNFKETRALLLALLMEDDADLSKPPPWAYSLDFLHENAAQETVIIRPEFRPTVIDGGKKDPEDTQ